MNIAGQTYTEANSNFTTAPALRFEYGEYVGVTFSLTITNPTAPYTAFSAIVNVAGENLVTATKAGVGQLAPVLADVTAQQVVIYFNTGANDTKDTVIPAGTVIRIRVTAAGDHTYNYEATTVAGETVGDITQQVFQNMKTADWNVTLLPSGKGIIVDGYLQLNQAGQPRVNRTVATAGINYSGAAQPVVKAIGAKLLIFENGEWKLKP